jgi:hypothetical protein
MAAVVEEQSSEIGQPLLPVAAAAPRQPGSQRPMDASHTLPDVVPPQSLSCVQPHWPPGRQAEPASRPLQAAVTVGVHSTQACVGGSHTSPPEQSAVVRHCTHCCPSARSQRGCGS